MPQVYKFDLKRMSPNVKLMGQKHNNSKVYFNDYREKYGRGFGGISELVKTGINLVKDNKDLIIEGGKAAGSLAKAVSQVTDAVKEENKMKELELVRQLRREAEARNKVTQKTKDKTANIGDGFSKF